MGLYWKDVDTDAGRWLGLAVECEDPAGGFRKPALRLESGHHGRMRLVQEVPGEAAPATLFWARQLAEHAGVQLLRNDAAIASAVPPSALDAATVERHAALPEAQRLASWSRVFVRALSQGPASFLYPGRWLFAGLRPSPPGWNVEAEKLRTGDARWRVNGVREGLRADPVVFIDWWSSSIDEVLNLRAPPRADDGRVKWWRKKSREGALPPVLLWYLGGLRAHVIVDGHCRLQAALLEQRPPEFVAAYSTREQAAGRSDPAARQAVLASLQRHADEVARKQPGRRAIDTDSLNAVLVAAFDDRPTLAERTFSWASRQPEAQWLGEVEARLAELGRGESLADFAQP